MASILVIDDEEILLNLYERVLTKFGHSVNTTSTGDKGIGLFESGNYDLVITDVVMKGMDGNTVARMVKTINSAIPVIGASGTPWKASKRLFDSVLGKPFSIDSLIEEVKQCLALKQVASSEEVV